MKTPWVFIRGAVLFLLPILLLWGGCSPLKEPPAEFHYEYRNHLRWFAAKKSR